MSRLTIDNFICFSGNDGVGKSTQINELIISNPNIQYNVIWARNFHFFTRAINFIGYVLGLNIPQNKTHDGYHKYTNFFGHLYVLSNLIDYTFFFIFLKFKKIKSKHLIFDRCIIDLIVDLLTSTGKVKLILFIFSPFVFHLKKNSKIIVIFRRYDDVILDRPDIKRDSQWDNRNFYYKFIARYYHLEVVYI